AVDHLAGEERVDAAADANGGAVEFSTGVEGVQVAGQRHLALEVSDDDERAGRRGGDVHAVRAVRPAGGAQEGDRLSRGDRGVGHVVHHRIKAGDAIAGGADVDGVSAAHVQQPQALQSTGDGQ